jgi:flagellar basal-body rod protein FlgF
MDVSLYQAAAAMNATARWQEMISDNLTNASIPGGRKREISFSAIQAGQVCGMSGISSSNFVMPAASSTINFQPGEMRPSGGMMDVALEGPGLFTVQMPNKQLAYTRNGQFELNSQGQLVTGQGYPVLGDNGPIQFDAASSKPITISASGEVSQGTDGKGRLRITEFSQPGLLTPIGSGIFRADNPASKPTAETTTQVRQGFIEQANTSPTTEMASLITAMRMFDANAKVLQMQSDRMGREITDLGNPS